MNYKLILVVILAGLAVLFIIQNVAIVEIQFLLWSIQISRSLLIFLLIAMGIIIGWFLHSYLKYRKGKTLDDSMR
ncbi:MAG: LapA family protein [Deltaproteobacteria bacterium]|nr:LapA family protein [Deltaproteobacteria bacterium]